MLRSGQARGLDQDEECRGLHSSIFVHGKMSEVTTVRECYDERVTIELMLAQQRLVDR